MPYETLNPEEVIATVGRLKQRIEDRFPGSGLGRVCLRLLEISHQASERAKWIERPIIRLRIGTWLLAAALVAVIGFVLYWLKSQRADFDLAEAVQMIDAGTSTAIVVGGLLQSLRGQPGARDLRAWMVAAFLVAAHANQPCSIQPSRSPGGANAHARWPREVSST